MEHFPDDLLIQIFLKLPVISLLVSRSVSKHWHCIIRSPNFITLHIDRPINNRIDHYPLLILRPLLYKDYVTQKIVLTMLSGDEAPYFRFEVPLELLSPSMSYRGYWDTEVRLIGPCNGVFCVTDMVDLLLFNPATRQCKNVPRNSPSIPQSCMSDLVDDIAYFKNVGFGFDFVSNDYKVVRFVMFDDNDGDDTNNGDNDHDGYSPQVHVKVEIFSLSSNSWREIDCIVPPSNIFSLHRCILFFNGALHWLGADYEDDFDDISSIIVFDLNEEGFEWFELPGSYTEGRGLRVYLSVLNESLTLIVHMEFSFEIWAMTKYGVNRSWMKLYDISDVEEVVRPLWFGKNEEFLVELYKGKLASFNLIKRELKDFYEFGVPGSMYAFRYRESLVSLQ